MLVLALDTATSRITAGVVELDAAGPPRLRGRVDAEGARAHAELLAPGIGTVLEQAIRFEADTITVDPDLAVEAFYADCEPADAADAVARLVPEHAAGFGQSPRAVAWRERPSTYVLCTEDRAVLPPLQRNLAARCDDVVEIAASHSPFTSRPGELTSILLDLARRVG